MSEDIPFDLEMFLITHGFYESERPPNYVAHGKITRPKVKKREYPKQWTPSYYNEEPPF